MWLDVARLSDPHAAGLHLSSRGSDARIGEGSEITVVTRVASVGMAAVLGLSQVAIRSWCGWWEQLMLSGNVIAGDVRGLWVAHMVWQARKGHSFAMRYFKRAGIYRL